MKRTIALLLVCIGMALPYLKSMEVMPTQADWSGWTARDGWVGTTFTANFDSIAEVQVFIGHVGDTSHRYNVEVRDYATNERVAYRHDVGARSSQGHEWLRFSMTPDGAGKFTRGKEYLLKLTGPGKAMNWCKSALNNCHFGHMVGCGLDCGV